MKVPQTPPTGHGRGAGVEESEPVQTLPRGECAANTCAAGTLVGPTPRQRDPISVTPPSGNYSRHALPAAALGSGYPNKCRRRHGRGTRGHERHKKELTAPTHSLRRPPPGAATIPNAPLPPAWQWWGRAAVPPSSGESAAVIGGAHTAAFPPSPPGAAVAGSLGSAKALSPAVRPVAVPLRPPPLRCRCAPGPSPLPGGLPS